MRHIIVGMGEVGRAHYNLLSKVYDQVETFDISQDSKDIKPEFDLMHICFPYIPEYEKWVKVYLDRFKPKFINICTTVPPGTTEKFGPMACHSTTRGLHPHLDRGLQHITKFIGVDDRRTGDVVAGALAAAGIKCKVVMGSRTTELAHILNNASYGINLMFAQEMSKLCRAYGVDYYEAVMNYTSENNAGFGELGHRTKVRPVLTPPGSKIGGHCVVHSAGLIPEDHRGPLLNRLAHYNDELD